jgi:Flp pilus assembly secretin CpaC
LEVDAMFRPHIVIATVFSLAAICTPALAAAQSAPLSVGIDQAMRIPLRAAAGSVIVGNPLIADVTVVDSNTLYITGKGYGITEIVAVDAIGRTVFQRQIVVSEGTGTGRVRVWRGGQATEMACGSSCSPSVRSAAGGGSASSTPSQ